MADIASLVKALKDKAIAQYEKGAPYRQALASALKGDTQGINQALSKSDLTPMDFAMTFAPLGITAYHGSPATNIEKFDPAKLKSGTGVNAYSPGFYFSESPAVGKSYQNKLSGWTPGTKSLLQRRGGDIDSAIEEANRTLDFYKKSVEEGGHGDLRRAQGMLEIQQNKLNDLLNMKAGVPENKGALYTVDIADESIPKMLDWENPVPEHIRKPLSEKAMQQWQSGLTGQSGEHLYKELAKNFEWSGSKTPELDATNWLLQNGVPGMKYMDRGNDNWDGFTAQNYVVYDPNLIKILEKK